MKKLKRRLERFKGVTIGLDLHKDFIEYSVLNQEGDETATGRINSTPVGLAKFLAHWSGQAAQVAIEACGCFIWVYDLIKAMPNGPTVHVAAPGKMEGTKGEKDDSSDAWWLAYLLHDRRLIEAQVVEGTLRDLRIAERELRSYTDQRADLLRRLKSHLAQEGLRVPRAWQSSKKGWVAAQKVLAQVKGERRLALRQLFKQIKVLTRMMLCWRARVRQHCAEFPAVKLLAEQMPGFGETVSATVYAELNDPGRYHSAKAYAKATGLTPGLRRSGGKVLLEQMSREGSRWARWAFTRAVISCLRCKRGAGAQIRAWVAARQKYKPKRKVIVAAARKLAEGVWRLFKFGEVFDLARAFPVRQATG